MSNRGMCDKLKSELDEQLDKVFSRYVGLTDRERIEVMREAFNRIVGNANNKRIKGFKLKLYCLGSELCKDNGVDEYYDGELLAPSLESGLHLMKTFISDMTCTRIYNDVQAKVNRPIEVEDDSTYATYEVVSDAKQKQKYGNIVKSFLFRIKVYEVLE